MSVREDFQLERGELERVLSSEVFERSPSLAKLLTYICAKYFEGTADSIKEYNIAVEALSRPPDFDQKKDAIIRVQMHRLREHLGEYYQTSGAADELQIVIAPGRYIPKFVRRVSAADAASTDPIRTPSTPTPEPDHSDVLEGAEHETVPPNLDRAPDQAAAPPNSRRYRSWAIAAVASLILVAAAWSALSRPGETVISAAPVANTIVEPTAGEAVRILCGLESGTFIDGFGRTWLSDRYFTGGSVVNLGEYLILGTREQRLYQSSREGTFTYDIPLKPGVYEMRLHFAEARFGEINIAGWGGDGSRRFGIVVNGNAVMSVLDVAREVGPRTADIKVFRDVSPAPDGILHLSFSTITSVPFLNAIELTPGVKGKLLPIRLVARDHVYRDTQGRQWEPDRYASGGQLASKRIANMTGPADPNLFAGERFGNLKYVIPVTRGKYAVTFYMSEPWFGADHPGGGGAGSRLFDIVCNGVALVRDLDIFQRVGGADREFIQTFHGLEPNFQEKLELSLIPHEARAGATLNALEIIDEGP